jgi:aspartyl-tRNA(Asn)/glutamyl-tRNA(Gln) amidotransferase subunit B
LLDNCEGRMIVALEKDGDYDFNDNVVLSQIEVGAHFVLRGRPWSVVEIQEELGISKEEAEDYRYFPEPDLVPIAPTREWGEQLRAGLPELPRLRRNRLRAEWGISAHEMESVLNAGAIGPILATIDAGADAGAARKWWMGELARRANEQGIELTALPITPQQVARVAALVAAGSLNDKLARQTIEGVLAGEGTPDEVVARRGLAIVSDDGALGQAVDEAIAGNQAIADKIRGGKVAAAGAGGGAVMKATRGQAAAGRVGGVILG